jgi:hypothetical protein
MKVTRFEDLPCEISLFVEDSCWGKKKYFEALDELISKTTNLSVKISNLMEYLKKSDFKGSKFH